MLLCFLGVFFLSNGTNWSINIPRQLSAVAGSCVIIPCTFSYPSTSNLYIKLIWLQVKEHRKPKDEIIYHSGKMTYNKRTTLTGQWRFKDCSLQIRDLRKEDATSYRLMVEGVDDKNYTYPNAVSLQVEDKLPIPYIQSPDSTIVEGKNVTLTCRINHTCPYRPPSWKWNVYFGTIYNTQVSLGNGISQIISNLTFTASRLYQNMNVLCTTSYKEGGSSQSKGIRLTIQYPPENTSVIVEDQDIREGQNILLRCRSQCYPNATHYTWYEVMQGGATRSLPETSNKLLIINIERNSPSYYCSVRNQAGQANSPLQPIDVLYKPEIFPGSGCKIHLGSMECQCTVHANPPASITWSLSAGNINQSEAGYIVSSSSSGHQTGSSIIFLALPASNVSCYSANKLGSTDMVLRTL
ncbi:hypothetical protein GDO86_012206, partial [Hymenochirus boettgeri]